MTRLAYVSNFAWPYGWLSSAGRDASEMPTSPTTLPAESNTEWMPSACMDADPLMVPYTYLAAATATLSTSTIHSTRLIERMRSDTEFLVASAFATAAPLLSAIRPTTPYTKKAGRKADFRFLVSEAGFEPAHP